ncbi:DNA helicase [Bacillus cereus]|uniref:DEAD/DEAH box helicase n=1 Tax=Bacillus cereus TaxID=1396 RepID=UPI000BF85095|nr:DEAD/DEAH box helicase [Bacillus cereus]PEW10406.1 DNA helicase [Bacillus cereus]
MPKVAISAEFLKAMSNIPKSEQKKVREFTEKFRDDPTRASINYEPIHDMRDKKVRTVRIGLDYRAVVIHPPKGDVYLLVWVDHHDEAMRWAKNKVFEVNSETGALQIVDTEFIIKRQEEVVHDEEVNGGESGLFDDLSDKQLQKLGVPKLLLPSVRLLKDDDELDEFKEHLPDEAYEGLLSIAAGISFEETLQELGHDQREEVDIDDFVKALENPDTKRRFAAIESSEELIEMLNAPLDKWRVFLHPSQEKVVKGKYNGPVRVLGGAGTGKTVVAMHRAKYLLEKVYTKSSNKVLFVTYTSNLAKTIKQQLGSIVSEQDRKRVDVMTVHSFATKLLRQFDSSFQTINKETGSKVEEAWKISVSMDELGLEESFYREEWEEVVQTIGIKTEREYLTAKRSGRGTRINRLQRKQIWKVFEDYRNFLNRHQIKEWVDIVREARLLLENGQLTLPYQAVIVDEAQDLHPEDYKFIRSIVPEKANDIFIVGDAHQRIYKNKVVLGQCGINVRGARSKKLKINYRTTEQIRKWSVSLLKDSKYDDLDGGLDEQKGYKSLLQGLNPEVICFKTHEEEMRFIRDFVNSAILKGVNLENICIVARTNRLLESVYTPMLEKDNIPSVIIDTNVTDQGEGVRLATMHRVKGLEFSHVIIAAVNENIVPPKLLLDKAYDEISKQDVIQRERSLLYVAATRARDYLLVTSYGESSSVL